MKYCMEKIGGIIVICALLAAGCKPETVDEKKTADTCLRQQLQEQTDYYIVKSEPVNETIQLTGKVEYNTDKVVHFMSLVEGIVTNTYFSLGDRVHKGQLLAEVQSTELSRLESERKSLETQLTVANRQLQSVQSMYDDAIASQKDLLEAQRDVNVLKAELERTHANLSMFSASNERNVFQIKAPSSGFVVAKNITPGMQIAAGGEPMFTISDLSEVWVNVNVYAGNVVQVHENMPVSITTMSYPGEVFAGKIAMLPQVFDAEEHVLKARIVMKNPDMKLMPGMLADVSIRKDSKRDAPAIPAKALVFDNNKSFVVLSTSACDLEVREVNVLVKSNGVVYLAQGVAAGDLVVSKNNLLVYERLKTHVK